MDMHATADAALLLMLQAFGKTVPLCTWVAATDDPWYKVPDPDPWRSFGGCPAYVQPNPKDRALYYYTGQGAQVPDPASATAQCTGERCRGAERTGGWAAC